MRSFWSDPFLWIHLAGFAALPLWLELCWLGLAAGNPVLPFWLELLVVAAIGIAPILWMQWQRPFYIFSLLAVGLKPAELTEEQRRLLTLFKAQRNRFLAIAAAVIAFLALRQLYYLAPIAAPVTPFSPDSRWLGVLVAAIAFLGVNLFLQVPVSVLSVMLTGDSTFAATTPYPLEQIRLDFTLLGIPVNQILPPVIAEPEPVASVPAIPIPDSELERGTDATPAETTTTEEDLEADLWDDVDTSIESDAIAEVEAPVEAETAVEAEAVVNSKVIEQSETIAIDEEITNEVPLTSEQVDNSAAIADSEEPTDLVEIISSDASTEPEASTDSDTSTDLEPTTHLDTIADQAITDSDAIADVAALSDVAADAVETPNPDQVASAPIEDPAPEADPPSSTHHAPEDHKE